MTTLVTGTADFLGFHAARALLLHGDTVVGADSLNAYYDVSLRSRDWPRFNRCRRLAALCFIGWIWPTAMRLERLFGEHTLERVFQLAA